MAQGRSTKTISMIKWIRTSRLFIKNSLSSSAGALAGDRGATLSHIFFSCVDIITQLVSCADIITQLLSCAEIVTQLIGAQVRALGIEVEQGLHGQVAPPGPIDIRAD